ncbi:MAG: hypothetical protein WCK98_05450 [bacterium]
MPQLPTPAASGDVWGNTLNNFLTVAHDNTVPNGGKVKPSGIIPGTAGQVLTTTQAGTVGWQNSTAGAGGIVAGAELDLVGQLNPANIFGPRIYTLSYALNVQSFTGGGMIIGGNYTVTFINPLDNANYLVSISNNPGWVCEVFSKTVNSFSLSIKAAIFDTSGGQITLPFGTNTSNQFIFTVFK